MGNRHLTSREREVIREVHWIAEQKQRLDVEYRQDNSPAQAIQGSSQFRLNSAVVRRLLAAEDERFVSVSAPALAGKFRKRRRSLYFSYLKELHREFRVHWAERVQAGRVPASQIASEAADFYLCLGIMTSAGALHSVRAPEMATQSLDWALQRLQKLEPFRPIPVPAF